MSRVRQNDVRMCGKRYLEKRLETLLGCLLLEPFLLFGAEVTRLFGLLDLVKDGFELDRRAKGRHSTRIDNLVQNQKLRDRRRDAARLGKNVIFALHVM